MTLSVTDLIGTMGIGGLFLGSVIEALGIPFPGGLMVIFAGILVNGGKLEFLPALVAAVGGFNLGAAAAYFLGRYVGEPLFDGLGRYLNITPARLESARNWMENSAAAFIIFGRFVPMVSNFTPYMAGMSRLRADRFFLYNSIFATAWAGFYLLVGMFFSRNMRALLDFTESRLPLLAAAAIIIYIVVFYFIKKKIRL